MSAEFSIIGVLKAVEVKDTKRGSKFLVLEIGQSNKSFNGEYVDSVYSVTFFGAKVAGILSKISIGNQLKITGFLESKLVESKTTSWKGYSYSLIGDSLDVLEKSAVATNEEIERALATFTKITGSDLDVEGKNPKERNVSNNSFQLKLDDIPF